jgi:4-diphosphocytidyl-2-C-methyl-D-erythritol kinase
MSPISVRSFAKINLGLVIGPKREDGFHELRTVYQNIGLHDVIKVDVGRGTGVEIRCKDARVPQDESNTCWRAAERVMKTLKARGRVVITIEKRLPVQGGLGAASSNAVATMMALERAVKQELPPEERLRIAAEIGSDVPLFLIGGTTLGIARGEQVFPFPDLPVLACLVATPAVGISTPEAFAKWDELANPAKGSRASRALTASKPSSRIDEFSRSIYTWLKDFVSGVPAGEQPSAPRSNAPGIPSGGNRAGTPLLDLVRAGIVNDFEQVVFPEHPELREVKRVLEREGARYASLSGSGSALYGLFDSSAQAEAAAEKLSAGGVPAQATRTLTRADYWQNIFDF